MLCCAILGMRAGPTGDLGGALTGVLKTAADSCIKGENTPVMHQDSNNYYQSDSGYGDSFSSSNGVCVSGGIIGGFDWLPEH